MTSLELFNAIRNIIKTDANYKPRQFNTIGGMWTVDTWEFNGITYQLQDEGYTSTIQTPKFYATKNYNDSITIQKGDDLDLLKIYQSLI